MPNEPRREKTGFFAYAKTKAQISFAVTVKLISAFVFATRLVQSLYFLNPKFQVSNHLLWLNSLVCVRPGQNPLRPVFSQRGSNVSKLFQASEASQAGLDLTDWSLIQKARLILHCHLTHLFPAMLVQWCLLKQ